MIVPFIKAHGAKNDFLLTWASQAPLNGLPELAIAICDRHTGIGADGWMLVEPAGSESYASIRLINSDGSPSELSGNGTRCAAAMLIDAGHKDEIVNIVTGAGLKRLKLLNRENNKYFFEMNMGSAVIESHGPFNIGDRTLDATILNVGNPQCAIFVDEFPSGWQEIGAAIERHPRFPNRTNVSFVKYVDPNTIDVRFFERGAGETMSSGTGSTGAAAAAVARGLVKSPVTVRTVAGDLRLHWDGDEAHLAGPAEIIAKGEFYFRQEA
ncbi:MAG TPA: diaminopimelate epimerase [Bryobacteraceae bacterium]|nr:diaminopimelate epimerase [Bryobacteraceae bacterium]